MAGEEKRRREEKEKRREGGVPFSVLSAGDEA